MNSTNAAMSGNAAKMVADSTSTVPEPVKAKKKKKKLSGGPKPKKKKTNAVKRSKDRADLLAISDLHDESDSDLDLKRSLKPISGYIKVRSDMLEQMFHSVRGPSLQRTLPDILKDLPIEELKRRCLDQLENMSKKCIRRIIGGDKPENISSSETEESSDEEEDEKRDADSTSQPADTGGANLADIEAVDDEQLLADVASTINKTSLHKKDAQSGTASPNTDAGLNLNIAPSLDHSELEILELEMRARAIKAMLRANVQRNQDSTEPGGPPEPGGEQSGVTLPETRNKDNKQAMEKGKSPTQQNAAENSPFENVSSKLLGQKASMQIVIGKKTKDLTNAGKKVDEKTTDTPQKKTDDEEKELVKLLEEQKRKAALEKPDPQPGTGALQIKTEKRDVDSQPAKDPKHRQRSYSTSHSRSRSRSDSGSERRRSRRRNTSDSYSDRSRSDDSRDSRHSRHIRRRRQYRRRRRSSSRSTSSPSDSYSSDDFSDPHRHRYPLQTPRFNPKSTNVNAQFAGPMKRMKWVKKPKKPVPVEDREEGEVSDESEWEQVTDNEQANVVIKIEPDDDVPSMARNRHKLMSSKAIKTEPGLEVSTNRLNIKVEPQDGPSKQNQDSVTSLTEVKTSSEDVQIMIPLSTLEYITIESSDSDMDSVCSASPDVASVTSNIETVTPDATTSADPNIASVMQNVTSSIMPDMLTSVGSEPVPGSEKQTLCCDSLLPKTEVIDSTSSESPDERSNADSCIIKQETQDVCQSEDMMHQKNNPDQCDGIKIDTSCSEKKPVEALYTQSSSPHISVQSSEKPDSVKSNEEPNSDVITISSTGKATSSQIANFSRGVEVDLAENVGVQSSAVVVPEKPDIDLDDGDTIDGMSDIISAEPENKVSNTSQSDSQHEGIREGQIGSQPETTKDDHQMAEGGVHEGDQGGGFEVQYGEKDQGGSVIATIENSSNGSVGESDEEVQNVSDDESDDIQDWSDLEGRKVHQGASDAEDGQGGSQMQGGNGVNQDGSQNQSDSGLSRDRLQKQADSGMRQDGSNVGRSHQNSQGECGVEALGASQHGSGAEDSKTDQTKKDRNLCVVVTDDESCDEVRTGRADSDSDVSDGEANSVDTEHETDTEDTDGDDDAHDTSPVVTVTAGQTHQRVEANDDAVVLDDDNEILD